MNSQVEGQDRLRSLESINHCDQLPRYSLTGGKLCPEQLSVAHSSENRLKIATKFSNSCPRRRFENQVNVEVQRITEQLSRPIESRNSRLRYDPDHSVLRNAEINVKARWDERGIWNHDWPDFLPGLVWGHEGTLADFNLGPNVYLQTFDDEAIRDQYLTRESFPRTSCLYRRWGTIPYASCYKIGWFKPPPEVVLTLSEPAYQFSDETKEEIEWFYGEPQVLVDHDAYRSFIDIYNELPVTSRRVRGVCPVKDPYGRDLPVDSDGSQRVVDIFGHETILQGDKLRRTTDPYGDISHNQKDWEHDLILRTLRKRWQAEEIWDFNWHMWPKGEKWLHESLEPEELKAVLAKDAGRDDRNS